MLVIFPRRLIHPLKQVAAFGYRSSPKAPLWVAYPLQQPLGLSSRKPIGEGSPFIQPTIGTANPSPFGTLSRRFNARRREMMRTILSAIFVSAVFLTSPGGAFAAGGYIQASSLEDQIVKEANKPQAVTMKSTDAAKGIKNNNGVVLLDQTGTYFTVVGVQVGSRGGTGLVRLWFQTNGKDVDNTNCEQTVPNPEFTTVMISQGVAEYKKGDKINAMMSGSAPGIGFVYKKPSGEPAVPSVIFSAWKID